MRHQLIFTCKLKINSCDSTKYVNIFLYYKKVAHNNVYIYIYLLINSKYIYIFTMDMNKDKIVFEFPINSVT